MKEWRQCSGSRLSAHWQRQGTGDTPPVLAQQERSTGPAAAPPQSWYEAMAERVHVGGYGSFRYETNDLQEFNNSFDFRRFVLTLDARPAPRLHFNFELEFERFTVAGTGAGNQLQL